MKDQFLLFITGLVCAAAWAFWHFFGAGAMNVLCFGFMLALMDDNRRLRAKLRQPAAASDADVTR